MSSEPLKVLDGAGVPAFVVSGSENDLGVVSLGLIDDAIHLAEAVALRADDLNSREDLLTPVLGLAEAVKTIGQEVRQIAEGLRYRRVMVDAGD